MPFQSTDDRVNPGYQLAPVEGFRQVIIRTNAESLNFRGL